MTKETEDYGSVERTPDALFKILNPAKQEMHKCSDSGVEFPTQDKYQILLNFARWAKDQSCDIYKDDCTACAAYEILQKIGEGK